MSRNMSDTMSCLLLYSVNWLHRRFKMETQSQGLRSRLWAVVFSVFIAGFTLSAKGDGPQIRFLYQAYPNTVCVGTERTLQIALYNFGEPKRSDQ